MDSQYFIHVCIQAAAITSLNLSGLSRIVPQVIARIVKVPIMPKLVINGDTTCNVMKGVNIKNRLAWSEFRD